MIPVFSVYYALSVVSYWMYMLYAVFSCSILSMTLMPLSIIAPGPEFSCLSILICFVFQWHVAYNALIGITKMIWIENNEWRDAGVGICPEQIANDLWFTYCPSDTIATPSSLVSLKFKMAYPACLIAFSALVLLVGWQEGHPPCKKLSGGRKFKTPAWEILDILV